MHRFLIAAAFAASSCHTVYAGEISSVYTDLVVERDCTTFATNEEGDGEFVDMVCNGYRGYPVIIRSADMRESVFYGFPPSGDTPWESFAAFNSAGPKIEWRVEKDGRLHIPFATIHRWNVSDPEDAEKQIEVLVVAKVGQLAERDGCAIGLVVATGNPKANETARRIADEQASSFACGADERVAVSGDVPLPEFSRQEN